MTVSDLHCEGLVEPTTVHGYPRFSWRLRTDARGARQSAYQIRINELDARGQPVADGAIDTGRIDSEQSQWVQIEGFQPKPKTRYTWQARVWDERGQESGWSEPAHFEMGLGHVGWAKEARWIGDGETVPLAGAPAARYLRRTFEVTPRPVKARLYLATLGLVEPWINGQRVGQDYFLTGWPDYRKRAFYVAYDVTPHLQDGANTLGLILGDGWYSGTLMARAQAGRTPQVSAFLEITNEAGEVSIVATDAEWKWAHGPIVEQGIYHGETYDARRDDPQWSTPNGGQDWQWKPVQLQGTHALAMTPRLSPPVRKTQEIVPVSRKEVRPGVYHYDLGQNMVGWVKLKVNAPAGQEVTLRFAEMLETPETLHLANLRAAKATARYVSAGRPSEVWEPRFTFFGFRYVELTGLENPADDAVTGVVIHSDLQRIGEFECSDPLLNQLFSNTVWGQRGNFVEVPTDCPQRDERLGWTGDAQVFAHTANYNYASGNFYRQWLAAVRDGYREEPDGDTGFPDVAPDTGLGHGSAGWGDAGVIIPWVTWVHTGDRRVLEENMNAIQAWVEAQAGAFPDGIRRSRRSYGDWLAPGYEPWWAPTPYVLIATAYYAHVTDVAARIADALGRKELAERNRALFQHIRTAFQREFVQPDGRIQSDEQTAYLLALGFNLVSEDLRPAMTGHLVRAFHAKEDHLATGFLGTPLVTPVLTAVGHADLAYKVLLQESYPGWLFSVKNGATTIWERWDSWTPEKGFHSAGMNSFNHYAYGSVVGWMYDTVAGLAPEAAGAGWKRFTVAPTPGGGLTHARARLETPYGLAVSGWRQDGDRRTFEVVVPPNTTAQVHLPVAEGSNLTEGGRPLQELPQASGVSVSGGKVSFVLAPGRYEFVANR